MVSGVFDARNFILIYSGNESNTFGTGLMINRKYKQSIMNFDATDNRIRCFGIMGEFNNITILSVSAPTEEKKELVRTAITINIIGYIKEFHFLHVSSRCVLLIHTNLLSVLHTNLLYNTTISLAYMFRLFSVIIRPY